MDSRVTSDADLAAWIFSDDYKQLERITRMQDRLERAWYRSMACLDKLQAARKREELRAARESAAEARQKAAEAKRAASESRRKSDEMLQELLMPSDYRDEIGFVSHRAIRRGCRRNAVRPMRTGIRTSGAALSPGG